MTEAYRAGTSGRCLGGTGTTGHNSPVTITIPGTVQAGDYMQLVYVADSATGDAGGQGTINTPAGWTRLGTQQNLASAIAAYFWKVAASGDIGATVTVDYGTTTAGAGSRAALTFDSWSGSDPTTPVDVSGVSSSSTASATHVMPTIDTTGKGTDLIISAMADREATESASYSASGGWTIRNTSLATAGTISGNPGICVVDSGTAQAPGTGKGGGTITGGQTAQFSFGWTIALAPVTATQTARPTIDITTTNWATSTVLGGGVQDCTLVADSNDSTFLTSQSGPSAQVFEGKLPVMTAAPETVTSRIRFGSGAVSGIIKTELIQGTTVIATRTDTYSSAPPTAFTNLVLTLTGTQQAAISNLSDLRIRVTVTAA
jgi:hypothetical protein